jgi:hypothetical protein
MFILPWLKRETKSPTGTVSHAIHLFLEKGGTQLISLEPAQMDGFLSENGLVPLERFKESGVQFVRMDTSKLDISSFYSFNEEAGKGLELWRTFLWIGEGEADDPWGTNKYLEQISLSNIQVSELIKTILRRSAK